MHGFWVLHGSTYARNFSPSVCVSRGMDRDESPSKSTSVTYICSYFPSGMKTKRFLDLIPPWIGARGGRKESLQGYFQVEQNLKIRTLIKEKFAISFEMLNHELSSRIQSSLYWPLTYVTNTQTNVSFVGVFDKRKRCNFILFL